MIRLPSESAQTIAAWAATYPEKLFKLPSLSRKLPFLYPGRPQDSYSIRANLALCLSSYNLVDPAELPEVRIWRLPRCGTALSPHSQVTSKWGRTVSTECGSCFRAGIPGRVKKAFCTHRKKRKQAWNAPSDQQGALQEESWVFCFEGQGSHFILPYWKL